MFRYLLLVGALLGAPLLAQSSDSALAARTKVDCQIVVTQGTTGNVRNAGARCKARQDSIIANNRAPAPVASVVVAPASTTLLRGSTQQFIATLRDAQGNTLTRPITWSSNDVVVATVSATGFATALAAGRATITASAEGVRSGGLLTVLPPDPEVPPPVVLPPDTARFDGPAELPRAIPDVTYPAGVRRALRVAVGGKIQAVLDSAKCGDDVIIPALTHLEALVYRKTCTMANPIVLRSDGLTIPVGTRMTPSKAATIGRIQSPAGGMPVLTIAKGACGLRGVGLDLSVAPGVTIMYDLVRTGEPPEATAADVPCDIVFDRMYVHGRTGLDVRRGISLNCRNCAVVDSWLDEITSAFDAAAVWAYTGPGPILIQNNRLDATGENVMFGGADPTVSGTIPSDITVRGNHITKPLAWVGVWMNMKNLFETKNARRVLVEGNVFENSVQSSQPGYALVLSATDQDCRAPWSTVSDITFRWNRVTNVLAVFNIVGWSKACGEFYTQRVQVRDNLFGKITSGLQIANVWQHNARSLSFVRNTFEGSDYVLSLTDSAVPGAIWKDNLAATWTWAHSPNFGLNDAAWAGHTSPGGINTGNVYVTPGTALPSTPGVDRAILTAKLLKVVVSP